jgi:hypothetical protein
MDQAIEIFLKPFLIIEIGYIDSQGDNDYHKKRVLRITNTGRVT